MVTDTDLTLQTAAPRRVDGFAPIGGYAAIGDGGSLALVADDGSIDWMCAPQLSSPSVFGAILDPARGGRFSLAPAIPFRAERRYLERTNVLQTTFTTGEGRVRVTDAISRPGGESTPGRELVRRVEGIAGRVPLRWRVAPRFGYGRVQPRIEQRDDGWILSEDSGVRLGLQTWQLGTPSLTEAAVGADTVVAEGSRGLIAICAVQDEPLLLSRRDAVDRRLDRTIEHWTRWLQRSRYDGPWRAAVERSLLAIGLLADDHTGAIAAAGTTSLPEVIGGQRNFDYRFAWVRDASFTLDALMRIGLEDIAHRSLNWLLQATNHTQPRVNPVYRLDGAVLEGQASIAMTGYRASAPVVVGNQATHQLQLGGFGDLLETLWLYVSKGGVLDPASGERIAEAVSLLARIWRREDAGLWELGDYAQYTTSKLGCWVAFDRALRLAEARHIPARSSERWRTARDAVKSYIEQELWSDEKRSYLQKAGSAALDAGCLLMSRRGFADPGGERMNTTINAVRRELDAGPPLLYRYSGMQDSENAFLACSFWLVEALARAQRHDEAATTMGALVALSSDVGLYSEEMDPRSKAMRGNLPQALTHLALINAAVIFDDSLQQATSSPRPPDRTRRRRATATAGGRAAVEKGKA